MVVSRLEHVLRIGVEVAATVTASAIFLQTALITETIVYIMEQLQ